MANSGIMMRTPQFLSTIILFYYTVFHTCSAQIYRWMPAGGGSWAEPANWRTNEVPTINNHISVDLTALGRSMIFLPRNRVTAFHTLLASVKVSPEQSVLFHTHRSTIDADHIILGGHDNQGVAHFSLQEQSQWFSQNRYPKLIVGGVGQGIFSLLDQSRAQLRLITVGDQSRSDGLIMIKDRHSKLSAQEIILGYQGKGKLSIQAQGEASFDLIQLAVQKIGIPSYYTPEGTIQLEHAGTILKSNSILLAKQGISRIHLDDQAQLTTNHMIDQSFIAAHPSQPHQRSQNFIDILNQSKMVVEQLLEIGNDSAFDIRIFNGSHLYARSIHLNDIPSQEPSPDDHINNIQVYRYSKIDVQNLRIGSGEGAVVVTVNHNSQLNAKNMILGYQGEGLSYLQIINGSKYFGENAHIGLFQSGELVIANNSYFHISKDLHIGQARGKIGKVKLETHTNAKIPFRFGSHLVVDNIILSEENKASIEVTNHLQDFTPMRIQANICGEGKITKKGSGTLEMFGHQSWAGSFDIQGGAVEVAVDSQLSPQSMLHIHPTALLRMNSSQTVATLDNYGKVSMASQEGTTVLKVLGDVSGAGHYALHANFAALQSDAIHIQGKISGAHGLIFLFDPEREAQTFTSIPVAKAAHIANDDRLLYLESRYQDIAGTYQDIGLERYDLKLVREVNGDGMHQWSLERKKRDPARCLAMFGSPCHVSQVGQEIIHHLRWMRDSQRYTDEGILTPSQVVTPRTSPILPILSDMRFSTSQFRETNSKNTIGLSYQFPETDTQYIFEAFQTQEKTFSPTKFLQQAHTKNQILRMKIQHPIGWQTVWGIESSDFYPRSTEQDRSTLASAPYPLYHAVRMNTGVGYFWQLPANWSLGPEWHYSHWHPQMTGRTWSVSDQAAIATHIQGAHMTKIGAQLHYVASKDPNNPFAFSMAAYWNQHQENMQLCLADSHLSIPLRYTAFDMHTRLYWRSSEQSEWQLTTAYHRPSDIPQNWEMRLQWLGRF